jgi:integrase
MAVEKVALTDYRLRALKPAPTGKRVMVWDAATPHLAARVTDRGHVSFIVVRRRPGDRHPLYVVLGSYPGMKLADARKAAVKTLGEIMAGRHPAEVAKQAAAERELREAHSLAAAVDAFIEDERDRNLRSAERTVADLQREWLGRVRDPEHRGQWIAGKSSIWSARPVSEITRADIIGRLDQIKRANGKHGARHALSAIRQFFNWAADGERYGITASPCARIRNKTLGITGRDLKRTRILDDAELLDVWQSAEHLAYPFGKIYQLLMLTGQRLRDIACAKWDDVADGVLTVPAERYKTGNAQLIPLSPRAIAIFNELPRFTGPHVFTSTAGARAVSGFSKCKARIDEVIAKRRAKDGRALMPPWVVHDLRRSVRTRLVGDCGVEAYIAERVLGHALPGLHGVYDQGSHIPQKAAALAAWEKRLLSLVEPSEPAAPNVVSADAVARRRKVRRP